MTDHWKNDKIIWNANIHDLLLTTWTYHYPGKVEHSQEVKRKVLILANLSISTYSGFCDNESWMICAVISRYNYYYSYQV